MTGKPGVIHSSQSRSQKQVSRSWPNHPRGIRRQTHLRLSRSAMILGSIAAFFWTLLSSCLRAAAARFACSISELLHSFTCSRSRSRMLTLAPSACTYRAALVYVCCVALLGKPLYQMDPGLSHLIHKLTQAKNAHQAGTL